MQSKISQGDGSLRTMRTKPWPFWAEWKEIFGKDRAVGKGADDIEDVPRRRKSDADITDLGENSDYHISFDEFSPETHLPSVRLNEVGEDSTVQSEQATHMPKKISKKRKSYDDGEGLLDLLRKLHAETNMRLETLSNRIGYEMDLGKARQQVFEQLGSIPGLSEDQKYDLCGIIGKENSRLEIFIGLPVESRAGYVRRVLHTEHFM
ncbi:hypothetical protein AAHA92_16648 [Salvia divinorum]|uniref:Uncharacterized protein n=1 Tax=Salvia divinorum TaxID=28513 RepID=A0ABD1GWQ2_SALDI